MDQFGLLIMRPEWRVTVTDESDGTWQNYAPPYEVDWAFVLRGGAIGALIGAAFTVMSLH